MCIYAVSIGINGSVQHDDGAAAAAASVYQLLLLQPIRSVATVNMAWPAGLLDRRVVVASRKRYEKTCVRAT